MPKTRGEKLEPNLGCYINPVPFGCLECPLPQCVHDNPKIAHLYARRKKDKAIMESWKPGMTTAEVAKLWGLTARTLYRIKQRYQTPVTLTLGTSSAGDASEPSETR